MKKSIPLTVVFLTAIAFTSFANPSKKRLHYVGRVTDVSENSVTVRERNEGTEQTFKINENTTVTLGIDGPATLADVEVGKAVRVISNLQSDTADQIQLFVKEGAEASPDSPEEPNENH